MPREKTRIGLVGYGQIGTAVHDMIDRDAENGLEVVFVHDSEPSRLKGLRDELVLDDLGKFETRGADLIIEMAHPDVSREWATKCSLRLSIAISIDRL